MDFIFLTTAVEPDRSIAFTLTVVIAGMGIVLATLALLIVIFNVFGNAVSSAQNKAQEKKLKKQMEKEQKKEDDFVPLPPPPAREDGISPEIVAAISAAVYALEGEGAVISSIRRKPSSNAVNVWAQSAVIENTRPF